MSVTAVINNVMTISTNRNASKKSRVMKSWFGWYVCVWFDSKKLLNFTIQYKSKKHKDKKYICMVHVIKTYIKP